MSDEPPIKREREEPSPQEEVPDVADEEEQDDRRVVLVKVQGGEFDCLKNQQNPVQAQPRQGQASAQALNQAQQSRQPEPLDPVPNEMNQGMRMIPAQGPAQNQNGQVPNPWRAFLAEHLAHKPFALNQALQPNRAATQARNHAQQPWQPAVQNRVPTFFAAPFNLLPAQVPDQNHNVQAPINRGIEAPSPWREFLVGHLAQNPLGRNQAHQLNQAADQIAQNAAQAPNRGQPGQLASPNRVPDEIIGLVPREALHNEEAAYQLTPRAQNQQDSAQAQPLRGKLPDPTFWIVPRESQAMLADPLGRVPAIRINQIVAHVAAQARRNRGIEARHRRIQVAIHIPMPALAPNRDIQAPTVANQDVEDDDDDVIFLGEHLAPDQPEYHVVVMEGSAE